MTATDAKQIVKRQMVRSGDALMLALEPLADDEFFQENPNGFSAAWVVGHLACVADLFSAWHDNGTLLLDPEFHSVFNETAIVEDGPVSKAASVDRHLYPKAVLLLRLRQAMVKAQRVLDAFDLSQWDTPAPSGVPVSLLTGGAVWELLAVHVYWHCGELSGSMERFRGTYTLNILPHHFYIPSSE